MGHTGKSASLVVLIGFLASACGGAEDGSPTEVMQDPSGLARSSLGTIAASSLRLSAPTVTAGNSVNATVTLSEKAKSTSGRVIVYLSFDRSALAGPRFVSIPNGSSSGTFTLHTNPYLAASKAVTITANTSSPQASVFLTQVLSIAAAPTPAAGPAPQVASVALAASTVTNGTPVSGTVTLTSPAPAQGAAVQVYLSNDSLNSDADVPPVVIVLAGATQASFTVRTHLASSLASSAQEYVVSNYFGGLFQGATLTIAR
jgi:hypothetical protein